MTMRPADEQPAATGAADAARPAGAVPHGGLLVGRQARLAVAGLAVCGLAALFWPRGGIERAPGGFVLDANGRAATIGSHLEAVSLVHFWATWCPPCLTEIPALQRLAADFASTPEFGVVLVAVADDREKVRALMGEASATVLFDANWEVAHRYGTRQLPETYLVVHGKVVEKWVGATDWSDAGVRHRIREHLPKAEQRAALGP
jgi:thiol-disulfide isomerase/thioredoxin